MMKKKYILTKEKKEFLGKTLFRIKSLIDFRYVKKGELGGFIEKEDNLDQDGDAWVSGNAHVSGDAWVSGDAQVYGNAQVSGRFDLSVSIDFELPRIIINNKKKLMKLKKFLDSFDKVK